MTDDQTAYTCPPHVRCGEWNLRTFQLYWHVFQIGWLVFAFYAPMAHCTSPRRYAVQEFGLAKVGHGS